MYADAISTPAQLTRMSMFPAVSLAAAANWAAASCRVRSAERRQLYRRLRRAAAASPFRWQEPAPTSRRARRGLLGQHATRDGAVPGSCWPARS